MRVKKKEMKLYAIILRIRKYPYARLLVVVTVKAEKS
jgi:hypothetical protein